MRAQEGIQQTATSEPAQSGPQSRLERALAKRLGGKEIPRFAVILPDGRRVCAGGGDGEAPRFSLRVNDAKGLAALASMDESSIALAYLDGRIDVEGEFMEVLALRSVLTDRRPWWSLWRFLTPWLKGQVDADKQWIPRHYDHGNEFYFSFLDKEVGLYSQALYTREDETLEQAAINKLEYIVEACRLGEGSRILDVGGGWGAAERYLGRRGVNSTMLTLSKEQYRHLSEFAADHDLPCELEVEYANIFEYRPRKRFDAVILLGVMEHLPDYERLFGCFERLVRPGGFVYMDFAANRKKYAVRSFTYRYVFPGNHTPVVLPELLAAANQTTFEPVAVHNDRRSYYLTLKAWAEKLDSKADELEAKFGKRVVRLFQLYLWGCAQQMDRTGTLESFRVVFQNSIDQGSTTVGLG